MILRMESAASTDAVPSSASDNSTYSSDSVSSFCRIFSLGIIVCDSYRFIPLQTRGGTASNGDTFRPKQKHVCYLTFDDGPSKNGDAQDTRDT